MNDTSDHSIVDWDHEREFENHLRRLALGNGDVAIDVSRLADINFQRVMISAATPGRRDETADAVQEAAAAGAAAALASAVSQGRLLIGWPDGTQRLSEAGTRPFGPNNWLHTTSCALAARDAAALDILCEPAHIAASQLPAHLSDAFWPFLCAAVAAVVRKPDAAAPWIDEAERLLAEDHVSIGDPDVIRARVRPLTGVLRALVESAADVNAPLRAALRAQREYFAQQGGPTDPNRLLALDVVGLAALAHDRKRPLESLDLPAWLVRGEFERRPICVTLEYPSRRLERDGDAVAVLDLEGFPRDGREHVIVQRGDDLIARYTMRNGPGVPAASIDLALPGPRGAGESAAWPRALDPCERVLLADAYAHRAGTSLEASDGPAARAWLSSAVAQLDAVLAAIPPGAARVPEDECVSPRGRAVRAKEPGRLDRDRLTAYRDALMARQQRQNGPVSRLVAPPGDAQAREQALLVASVVGELARPLLTALASDVSGAVREGLRPRAEDYAKVFLPAAVDRARAWFESLWAEGLEMDLPSGNQRELLVHVAPAGMLAEYNEVSRLFPGAYRGLAALLNPHRAWVSWKYVRAGERSGLAYDGLVWCDDHWTWFPKPYRAFKEVIRDDREGEAS
jgi:hypothetical protein